MKCCPTCGQPIPSQDGLSWNFEDRTVWAGRKSVRVSCRMAKLFDALYQNPEGYSDQMALTDVVYADDPTGGPESAYNGVGIYLTRLRRQLAPLGWTVTYSHTKARRGYRLAKLAAFQSTQEET